MNVLFRLPRVRQSYGVLQSTTHDDDATPSFATFHDEALNRLRKEYARIQSITEKMESN